MIIAFVFMSLFTILYSTYLNETREHIEALLMFLLAMAFIFLAGFTYQLERNREFKSYDVPEEYKHTASRDYRNLDTMLTYFSQDSLIVKYMEE